MQGGVTKGDYIARDVWVDQLQRSAPGLATPQPDNEEVKVTVFHVLLQR